MEHITEEIEPLVRDDNDPGVGLDGGKWIVRGLHVGIRDGVEQGGLSDVRETDDTGFQ